MRYKIILAPEALEDFKRFKASQRSLIRDSIETHLRFEPKKLSKSRIKQLRSLKQPQYRLRVDDIRIFYDISQDRVEILSIIEKDQAQKWLDQKGKNA
jgi:mRNA-degrading endonuclease RelE of RelBE toxin-antitoxin system